jgi:hypothetical protein
MSAKAADTVSATVDATAIYLPSGWRIDVAGARGHHDEVTAAAETASPNAPISVARSDDDAVAPGWFAAALLPPDDERDPPTVVVYGAGFSQVGGIPLSLVTDTCRRGRSTA